jgi:catechol 2,3-dioxygenase-like lactoylglutathione lyase family enzyme
MNSRFAPVLSVTDPVRALEWFMSLPGVGVDLARQTVSCGDYLIRITQAQAWPAGSKPEPFDHLALRVGDVDAVLHLMMSAGAVLDPRFTPDGPREIPTFWDNGVRFAFLVGPGGAPVELCQRLSATGRPEVTGIDHLGLRCPDVDAYAARLTSAGARLIARHRLETETAAINVLFLSDAGLVWEVFDEVALRPLPGNTVGAATWAGITPI